VESGRFHATPIGEVHRTLIRLAKAPVVEGHRGLVTATMSPISVHAGVEALRQGGTAVDAAATVALTQVSTALGSYVSYARIMELVHYDAKSDYVG